MFDFFNSVFRHGYWLAIIVVLIILGAIGSCSNEVGFRIHRLRVHNAMRWDDTEKVYDRMHDYFVDDCHANPHAIGDRSGVLAAEALECCIDNGDSVNARKIYREYKFSLPDYAKKEYEGLE